MIERFADTYFYLAILNPNDAGHQAAIGVSRSHYGRTVTTSWVLTEVFDALSHRNNRQSAVALWKALEADSTTTIVQPSYDLLLRGIDLYEQRSDKDWSLTDCVSFVVMKERTIHEVLTGDRHFAQAGFTRLL